MADDVFYNRVAFKSHLNHDNKTYSMSVKTPVEPLPSSNISRTIYSLEVPLASSYTQNTFLGIKNVSNEDIDLRLGTFNITSDDGKSILMVLEVLDESSISSGTFTSYPSSTASEYSTDLVIPTYSIPNYPNIDTDNFGASIKDEIRLNLLKDDITIRWKQGQVLCFTAFCKNAVSFDFFIRHIEEF